MPLQEGLRIGRRPASAQERERSVSGSRGLPPSLVPATAFPGQLPRTPESAPCVGPFKWGAWELQVTKTHTHTAPSPSSTAIETAVAADDCDGRDGARQSAYLGGYCAAKSPPAIEALALRVRQDPLEAIRVQGINENGPCAVSDGSRSGGHGQFLLTVFRRPEA